MKLPAAVRAIRDRYVAVFPVPQGEPDDPGFEEVARQWCIRLAEQTHYDLGPEWGVKRADPNRPISKDSIAWTDGRVIFSWDLLTGVGTGRPTLVPDPESHDITDQVFVPVEPVNHLSPAPPVPIPVPPPTCPDYGPALDEIDRKVDWIPMLIKTLDESNERRYKDLVARIQALPVPPRRFTGSFKLPFFGTVTVVLDA